MHYICPSFCCIPWKDVCDGKWDCPHGNDELFACEDGDFKCSKVYDRSQQICLHVGSVCYGFVDCPNSDDEIMCTLAKSDCPKGCHCLLLAVACINSTFSQLEQHYSNTAIFVLSSHIVLKKFLESFVNLLYLRLIHIIEIHICNNINSQM